jgi:hypothetical protein
MVLVERSGAYFELCAKADSFCMGHVLWSCVDQVQDRQSHICKLCRAAHVFASLLKSCRLNIEGAGRTLLTNS